MTSTAEGDARCVVCEGRSLALEHASPSLRVMRCTECGHRVARHATGELREDYHEHAAQSPRFIESLRATRLRQANRILAWMERANGGLSHWLDFGCGRGWFLDVLRGRASGPSAGFDSSVLSRRWLREHGGVVAEPRAGEPDWPDWTTLPFAPRIVSFLDVVEHFEGAAAERALTRLRLELPELDWLVVKVPRAEGVLYRTARALVPLAAGPYEQLYQVGTFPPHYHYFGNSSLRRLLVKAGYDVAEELTDRDVDDLFARIGSLASLPGGGLAARAVGLFEPDSSIMFARVAKR